ncbi:acetyl-CoA carboxylase biotin carboxyl carrier protein [Ruminococcus albus]|jgi:acetyl-CoA carboxylase biotin carboxyl carrier protein|uniref:acetyl-CoA carboxylase biotin carboxyl carrier protein n=1 Tax=Ruminococcus albus TaxID=1264 RepID=UPI000465E231|nr:acetyl-CoA carboxylase biotin carboxyl carrier protein [Ruminococcus albus]MBP5267415.1 acetyl-CoA carboxylase biotin carboxyl carrier protein [Ruminococcus sp.]
MSEKIYGQFDLETIEKLADIINAKELSELTITDGDKTITIKGKRCVPAPAPMPVMPPMGMPPMGAPAPMGGEAPAPAAVSGTKVTAPIVGTFYAAPSPDSKPFVKVGDRIKKGDVIFIIESMKVMSEVPSEFDGVVKEICVQNGDAVEFGQTVMILE